MRAVGAEVARRGWVATAPGEVAVLERIVEALPPLGEPCPTCGGAGYVRVGPLHIAGSTRIEGAQAPVRAVVACPDCNAPTATDLLAAAGIPAEYAGWSLNTYRGDPDALAAVREWAASEARGSLLLTGGTGRGKTGLAVGAVRALCAAGVAAQFVTAAGLLDRVRAGFDDGTAAAIEAAYTAAAVLAIDDLAAARPTDWARERIPVLIDARLAAGRSTLVTLDKGAAWIVEQYDTRLASRFRLYRAVAVGGVDLRGDN